jgi:hypothetical protein
MRVSMCSLHEDGLHAGGAAGTMGPEAKGDSDDFNSNTLFLY